MHCIKDELISELALTEEKIRQNEQLFNHAENEEIIEALIYERKALESRYKHLLKTAKENGIAVSFIER